MSTMAERIRKIKLGYIKEPKPRKRVQCPLPAVYRTIMEKEIGRKLYPGEVVHHADLNTRNNYPDNLLNFASNADHTKFHKMIREFSVLKDDEEKVKYIRNNI